MNIEKHWGIFTDNTSNKRHLVSQLLKATSTSLFKDFQHKKGVLFSKLALLNFILEEDKHNDSGIIANKKQSLQSMSSGEQKKALFSHLLSVKPDFIILDNPFDNLDIDSQKELHKLICKKANEIVFIQLISRSIDLLPFIKKHAFLNKKEIQHISNLKAYLNSKKEVQFNTLIPKPISPLQYDGDTLVQLKNITVNYKDKTIIKNINWTIKKGEFWQLIGKNGSGKTTILSMITGENPKGYGQELYLFGQKKGSGESIWDIKKRIGYYTPSMTDKFKGYHTIENMIISGYNDSIGLYKQPTEAQKRLAKWWLELLGLNEIKKTLFLDLSLGLQRLVMIARAMVKQPLLLILDEPTAGLDDASALLFVTLINKIATESNTSIIFVSHRTEKNLSPSFIYKLKITSEGSLGSIKKAT